MVRGRHIVLGVDQGTTNTKVVALDRTGKLIAAATRPIATAAPEPGWVEQDPEVMFQNVVECIREVLEKTGRTARDALGLGISNQTETLVIWDRSTGAPAIPAIVWQCRRGSAEAALMRGRGHSQAVKERTGLDLDPTFTALKLMWVMANVPTIGAGLAAGRLAFGTVDTWLIWRLTAGSVYATEPGNASRTMLFDIERLEWSSDLLDLFGLSLPALPDCRRSSDQFGATDPQLFGSAIPITAALGDQQASLFGHGCLEKGDLKISYGTGAFVWVNAGPAAPADPGDGLIRTVAWQIDEPCYALEGFVMQAGAALEWVAQRLSLGDGGIATIRAAEIAQESAGAILVPAFQGLATPWWEPEVRAAFLGMSAATTKGHLAHSALEAVCYQIRTVLGVIEQAIDEPPRLAKVDGGLTRSRYFMQLQANVIAASLLPAASELTTPIGAALLAGLSSGLWDGLSDLEKLHRSEDVVHPDLAARPRWDKGYREWRRAIEVVMSFHTQIRELQAAHAKPHEAI